MKWYVVWDADETGPGGEFGPYSERELADNVAQAWPVHKWKNVRVVGR